MTLSQRPKSTNQEKLETAILRSKPEVLPLNHQHSPRHPKIRKKLKESKRRRYATLFEAAYLFGNGRPTQPKADRVPVDSSSQTVTQQPSSVQKIQW
jgi:hypothetical protein